MTHPDDPLAEWRFEFEEWRKAYVDFQQMEQDRFLRSEPPSDLQLREHRYVLFLLMSQGEQLGLTLLQSAEVEGAERNRLLGQLDGFLGSLHDSWHTWHGEGLPQHREGLGRFAGA
ncbi:MAG: hypothetical protein C5B50_09930 [Verrucomicrobia bacterium]|nr:MAG: hypothetical protein C5B50_09930 [Verrucomicrobiota bacterium]